MGDSKALRICDRLLKLGGEFIESHNDFTVDQEGA
jgi:hypothetical protein